MAIKPALFAACIACAALPAQGRDWGIVVGIDDYINFVPFDPDNPKSGHFDLQGALNDATVISDALRRADPLKVA